MESEKSESVTEKCRVKRLGKGTDRRHIIVQNKGTA